MTIFQGVILILGILLALALICLGVLFAQKNMKSRDYDERQRIARGEGYRVAFWTVVVYLFAAMMITIWQVEGEPPLVENYLLAFWGIFLPFMALHIYCFLTQAALPLSRKPGRMALSYLVLGSMQLINVKTYSRYGEGLPLTGYGSAKWPFLTLAICCYALSVMYFITMLHKEKEA